MAETSGNLGAFGGTGSWADLAQARSLILDALGDYQADVYLFGSFARGRGMLGSDIDVGVLPREPIPREVFSELRQQLEQSNLLFPVELIDLASTEVSFKEQVIREGVRWNEPANASK